MKKRTLALIMSGVMTLSALLGGCGAGNSSAGSDSGEGNSAENGEGYVTTYGEKQFGDVTIQVEVFDRSNAPEGSSVVDNKWVDYINEEMSKVGIHVEMVAVPRAEETTKVQVMMASGTAPDIIFTYDKSMAEDYYDKGGTVKLNDYIDGEGQAANLKAYVTEEVLNVCRNRDGDLWGVTAKRNSTAKNNLFIRKDWLDELNMEIPTTTDELYDVLKAFKENNPDNRDDVIACDVSFNIGAATVGILAQTFMESVTDETQYNISNFCPVYTDDGYVEYLRYLNKLYNDGLMDPEYYTSTSPEENMINGRTGFMEWGFDGNVTYNRLSNLQKNQADAEMVAIPALKNVNDGETYGIADPVSGMYIIIPKTCENVEAAITYLDWLATKDGGYVLYNGFEGEHYKLEDGVPVVIDQAYNDTDKDWLRTDLFLVGNPGYFESEEEMIEVRAKELGYEQYVKDDYAIAETGIIRSVPTYVSPTQTKNYSDIEVIMEENQVKCITCAPEDFDAQIETYRAALKAAGMDDVVAERTEYFSAN